MHIYHLNVYRSLLKKIIIYKILVNDKLKNILYFIMNETFLMVIISFELNYANFFVSIFQIDYNLVCLESDTYF
jgi:hypothetical protein